MAMVEYKPRFAFQLRNIYPYQNVNITGVMYVTVLILLSVAVTICQKLSALDELVRTDSYKLLVNYMNTLIERKKCPCCFSISHTQLLCQRFDTQGIKYYFKEHYQGKAAIEKLCAFNYELVRCNDCGLIYQKMIPSKQLLTEIYNEWVPQERLTHLYTLKDYSYCAEQVIFIIQYLKLPQSKIKIFDFGLGWSEWANMAKAFGCSVWGTELSKQRCDYAKSIGITVIDYEEITQHKFDFINTEQVFEHLTEPRKVLEHLVNALEPNGIIKISVPNIRKIHRKLMKIKEVDSLSLDEMMPIAPLEHINCFEYKTVVALADQVGLKPVTFSLKLLYQLYNSASGWLEPKEMARQTLRPLYRHLYPKSTFIYFAHK
jgi:2-polyprenyl-3-methyl-5-hydroxy-6-metoxy-1,4-benzoquinol methylase